MSQMTIGSGCSVSHSSLLQDLLGIRAGDFGNEREQIYRGGRVNGA